METVLDSAATWFLEWCTQHPSGELVIRLAEGVKGTERKPVSVGEKEIGYFLPVEVLPESRVVEVRFEHALALFTYNESYDTTDDSLVLTGAGALREVESSAFRVLLENTTNALTLGVEPLAEFLLWTENQVFRIFCSGLPTVAVLPDAPDPSIKRYDTWYAS